MSERPITLMWGLLVATLCVFVIVRLWPFALIAAVVLGFAYWSSGDEDLDSSPTPSKERNDGR